MSHERMHATELQISTLWPVPQPNLITCHSQIWVKTEAPGPHKCLQSSDVFGISSTKGAAPPNQPSMLTFDKKNTIVGVHHLEIPGYPPLTGNPKHGWLMILRQHNLSNALEASSRYHHQTRCGWFLDGMFKHEWFEKSIVEHSMLCAHHPFNKHHTEEEFAMLKTFEQVVPPMTLAGYRYLE